MLNRYSPRISYSLFLIGLAFFVGCIPRASIDQVIYVCAKNVDGFSLTYSGGSQLFRLDNDSFGLMIGLCAERSTKDSSLVDSDFSLRILFIPKQPNVSLIAIETILVEWSEDGEQQTLRGETPVNVSQSRPREGEPRTLLEYSVPENFDRVLREKVVLSFEIEWLPAGGNAQRLKLKIPMQKKVIRIPNPLV